MQIIFNYIGNLLRIKRHCALYRNGMNPYLREPQERKRTNNKQYAKNSRDDSEDNPALPAARA
jgi:hypothetical protein